MEIFVEFLDFYKLNNTKEIFSSETNFSYNKDIKSDLEKENFKKDEPIALQIFKKWKNQPEIQETKRSRN